MLILFRFATIGKASGAEPGIGDGPLDLDIGVGDPGGPCCCCNALFVYAVVPVGGARKGDNAAEEVVEFPRLISTVAFGFWVRGVLVWRGFENDNEVAAANGSCEHGLQAIMTFDE